MKTRVEWGQYVVTHFPILDVGPVPPFAPATCGFKLFGLVEEEKSYSYDELISGTCFPISTVVSDFHCVITWSKR